MSKPNLNDEQLQQALENCPAPRVTKEYMESRIQEVVYLDQAFGGTVTICNILLNNGFSIRGESACVNPENYNQDIGRKIAYDRAINSLWPLFGFLLAEVNHIQKAK